MSNISDMTEAWQGHSGLEVETFLKSQLTSTIAAMGGKFGYVDFNSQTMTISFYDEVGGTILGSIQLGGQIYTIDIESNLPQIFYVLADETTKMMTITPSTKVSSFGSSVSEDFPEPYTYTVAVNSGSGYVDRITGNINTGGSASFDIRPYLATGDNYIRVSVTGTSSGQTKSSVYTGTLTTLSMTVNHAWQNVWTQGQDYNISGIRFSGNLIKQLHVSITDGNTTTELDPVTYSANQSYTTTATYYTIPSSAFPSGGSKVVSVKLWMTAQGVSTPVVSYNIMCAASDDTTPLVAINSIQDRVYNFTSGTIFSYAVYNADRVSINMSATVNSVVYPVASGVTALNREDGTQYQFAYALEVDTGANETLLGSLGISVKAYKESTEGITTTASTIFDNTYSYLATPGYLFYLNAATRDNGSSNYETIVNEAGASANFSATYSGTWSGLSWYNDGWGVDPAGNKALNIPAGCSLTVSDLKPLALMSDYNGMTFEFMIQSGSPSDYTSPILSMSSGDTTPMGIIIYPTKIVVWGSSERDEDYQTINFSENAMTHICVTFVKEFEASGGKNLCSVYINGISNVCFSFDGASSFGNGALNLGQQNTDTYLYKMRIYGSSLESGAVFHNFLNCVIDGVDYSRAQLNAKNDVLLGTAVDYDLVKRAGFNTMVVTTPNNEPIPSFFNNVTIDGCTLKFEYAGQTAKNATITNLSMDGQGTTSKKYYRWNLRWKTGSDTSWSYGDGTSTTGSKTGQMINDTNYVQVDRITAKKNIASSPQGHKMGLTGLYNDLFHQIGLNSELPDSASRVAVYQFPFVGFQYNTTNQTYEFIGIYTAGPDKGSKKTFGYSSSYPNLLSIEGPNHAPRGTRFLCPWVDVAYDPDEETLTFGGEEGWDADYVNYETSREKGTQSDWDNILALYNAEWQPAYNCVYDNSPYLASYSELISDLDDPNITTLADLLLQANAPAIKGGTTNGMIVKNEFIAFYDSSYDLYFYRRSTGKYEKLTSSIYSGYTNALSGLSAYLTGAANPSAPTTEELIAARAARFKATMTDYFSQNQTIYHYCFCLLYGVTDNYAKNSYPFKFQALSSTGAGNRWGWRQDDLDSVLMTDNNGTNTKKYSVEHLDTVGGVQVFQGGDSALWMLIKANYEDECRAMMSQIATAANALATSLGIAGSGLHESLFNLTSYHCWDHSAKYFPATIYESDRRWSYIEPWLLAGTLRPGTSETYPDLYNGVAPLTQALGDQYQGEKLWMERRIAYIFSKYHIGAFHGTNTGYNAIVFTLAESFTFNLTPAIDLYPVVSLVDDDVVGDRTPAGTSESLTLSTSGDSNNSIHGGDWLASLGDLSGMVLTSRGGSTSIPFSITGARLQTLKVGDETAENVDFNATVFGVTSPTLVTLDAQNTATISNTVDLLGCPRLRTCKFEGSGAAGLYLPVGAKLTEVSFPDNASTVFMHSLPFLDDEGLTMPALDGIINLYVNNCPNLDPLDIAGDIVGTTDNSLEYATLIWNGVLTKTRTAIDTLTALSNISGNVSFSNNTPATVLGKADVEGTMQIDAMYSNDLEALDIVSEETYSDNLKKALVGLFDTPLYLIYNPTNTYISFVDSNVANICITNWGDGQGLTVSAAAAVSTLNQKFKGNTEIETFDELRYFTNMSIANNNSASCPFYYAFQGCTSLKSISLPVRDYMGAEGTYLFQGVFDGCTSLERVFWGPHNLRCQCSFAFQNCTSLKRLDIQSLRNWLSVAWPAVVQYYKHPFSASQDGHLYIDGVELTELEIPTGYSSVPHGSFAWCKGITSVKLPSTVTSINQYAFYRCSNITSFQGLNNVTTFNTECLSGVKMIDFIQPQTATYNSNSLQGLAASNINIKGTFGQHTIYSSGRSDNLGTLTMNGNVSSGQGAATAGQSYFYTAIFNGNVTGVGTLGIRAYKYSFTGNLSGGNGTYGITNAGMDYFEVLGDITSTAKMFVGACSILHVTRKITANPSTIAVGNVRYILIGDGSSSSADQAVLDAYTADTNWSSFTSKMILYSDYLNMVRVSYLESDGTQYCSIRDSVDSSTRYVIDAQLTTPSVDVAMFGSMNSNGTNRFHFGTSNGQWFFGVGANSATNKVIRLSEPVIDDQRHTFEICTDGSVAVDSYTGQIPSPSTGNFSLATFLFGRNNNGTAAVCPQKIYRVRRYNSASGQLLHDFVPVRIGQTGYFYDVLSGALLGNSGTGDFILGPDIQE